MVFSAAGIDAVDVVEASMGEVERAFGGQLL